MSFLPGWRDCYFQVLQQIQAEIWIENQLPPTPRTFLLTFAPCRYDPSGLLSLQAYLPARKFKATAADAVPQSSGGVTSWAQWWLNLCLELRALGPISPQRATALFSQPINPVSPFPDDLFQCQGPELLFSQDIVSLYLGLIFLLPRISAAVVY